MGHAAEKNLVSSTGKMNARWRGSQPKRISRRVAGTSGSAPAVENNQEGKKTIKKERDCRSRENYQPR